MTYSELYSELQQPSLPPLANQPQLFMADGISNSHEVIGDHMPNSFNSFWMNFGNDMAMNHNAPIIQQNGVNLAQSNGYYLPCDMTTMSNVPSSVGMQDHVFSRPLDQDQRPLDQIQCSDSFSDLSYILRLGDELENYSASTSMLSNSADNKNIDNKNIDNNVDDFFGNSELVRHHQPR
ncbi:hypothetical protein RIF29_24093 [Crotalaria pallida]|uniref:Uncharacterized protein n=1 Tax=Crotalaria pallida TaxID=3830 RepID=A0AAN9EJX7_CROPI